MVVVDVHFTDLVLEKKFQGSVSHLLIVVWSRVATRIKMLRSHTGTLAPATPALRAIATRKPRALVKSRGVTRVFAESKVALVTGANTGSMCPNTFALVKLGCERGSVCRLSTPCSTHV